MHPLCRNSGENTGNCGTLLNAWNQSGSSCLNFDRPSLPGGIEMYYQFHRFESVWLIWTHTFSNGCWAVLIHIYTLVHMLHGLPVWTHVDDTPVICIGMAYEQIVYMYLESRLAIRVFNFCRAMQNAKHLSEGAVCSLYLPLACLAPCSCENCLPLPAGSL